MSETRGRIAYITHRAVFSAAHRLYRDDLSPEANQSIFGKCATPFGHGHNYDLEVTLKGPVSPESGMVMGLAELEAIVDREVISKFDHRNLNRDVEAMAGINPTAEHLVRVIWKQLEPALPAGLLHNVSCRETPNNRSHFKGEH